MGPNDYAAQKLLAKGMNPTFVDLILKGYREDQREKVQELNILGFLRSNKSTATGEEKIPAWELKRVKKFLGDHRKAFKSAERQFNVQKEVIASLLWVETKHGKDLGNFHVASALFSLVAADYPTFVDQLQDTARKTAADYDKVIEAKIQERCRTKGEWAASELMALQEIHQRGYKDAKNLHGSFSGAFGMAQFMPSSYLAWAKGTRKQPNLFRADDSILSVANYLNSNGWQTASRDAQEGALFHYNRDKAYVNHILKMSFCLKRPLKKSKGRTMASIKDC